MNLIILFFFFLRTNFLSIKLKSYLAYAYVINKKKFKFFGLFLQNINFLN
jgi:hypothetical protein